MTEYQERALLPPGMNDVLPPDAAYETSTLNTLLKRFAGHGYQQVKPPLVEFEESLLAGSGASMTSETFRLMDPVSQRMMGVRADMTLQIARIATTRLKNAPRPLRLCYAGQVLQVKGTQLRPERQFGQAGVELIGARVSAADAEIVLLAVESLTAIGVTDLSVDLNLPPLVPALCSALSLGDEAAAAARAALDRKDAAGVAALGGQAAEILGALLAIAGPASRALAGLEALDLPPSVAGECTRLGEMVAEIGRAAPGLGLTIDPVENRGFEYHTGVGFVLFALGVRGELGRGGRYLAGQGEGEPATGVTLFMDSVLRAVPGPDAPRRLFLPVGVPAEERAKLRQEGWQTVAALADVGDVRAEARRLECSHVYDAGKVDPLTD